MPLHGTNFHRTGKDNYTFVVVVTAGYLLAQDNVFHVLVC